MSGRKLVVNFQAFDEREMHRKMVGAMVYSLLLFGLVIYLWENETFAIAAPTQTDYTARRGVSL